MNDAHRLLRDATRDAHERLDALFTGFDLGTADGYARFIGAQADAMLASEAALDAAGAQSVLEDWPQRRRGDLLRADLAALALPQPEPSPLALPRDPASLGAALYVLEGSRHGARHLRRLVPAGLPTAFLDAPQAPGNWAKLLAKLDTILYQPAAQDAAIAAAHHVFSTFEQSGRRWLSKEYPCPQTKSPPTPPSTSI
ncbi:biliverdin-producing heme oxygenase [Sphingomonas japonica]|uniref:Heme oxygenase n=1 Tax=Sphingomonas japonica TaxID=511662 RepID=A0ABX0U4R5_9SPHN|nr:biliverdin-producing heme oxygenase [Sphingomonas japonica]NIJ24371.1 heme oxygenase [Sphingomonas japonica]